MIFLGYPIEIWLGVFVAVIIKLKSSRVMTILGAMTTTLVAVGGGMLLHQKVIFLFGLDPSWDIFVAIILALTFENLMKFIVELSADQAALKDLASVFINRKSKDD